jgi:hypothetical protein
MATRYSEDICFLIIWGGAARIINVFLTHRHQIETSHCALSTVRYGFDLDSWALELGPYVTSVCTLVPAVYLCNSDFRVSKEVK